ncbi:MAG: Hsp20/alpha crystallin family protein [Pseudomonadota bacterium]
MFSSRYRRNRGRALPATRAAYAADPFFRMQEEMNRFVEDAFSNLAAPANFSGDLESFRAPEIDMRETEKAIEVSAELPGVAEEDLDVQINDGVLTIRGEKKFEGKEGGEDGDYRVMERSYGSFARSIPLGFDVDPDAVAATFKDGVLTLVLPKPAEVASKSRSIPIKRG